MIVYSIAAIAENRAIGKDNDLIWNLPDDMKFFKDSTLNQVVITGRKNFESIPHKYRPLPNRINIVLTRSEDYDASGALVYNSIEDALNFCKSEGHKSVFVIGGGQIYKLALEKNLVDVMYLTRVHESFEADSFYPEFDEAIWKKEIMEEHPKDDRHNYSYTIEKWTKK
ncbi:dihydrofolate reductase [Cryomorphaceae bacterium 1068]|nr:dihydrofolate reductase [Cryomorphaceae bacterium 1068]